VLQLQEDPVDDELEPSFPIMPAGAVTILCTLSHPQSGHGEVSPRLLTRSSYSFPHFSQWNL
jgi:hypothetical protein